MTVSQSYRYPRFAIFVVSCLVLAGKVSSFIASPQRQLMGGCAVISGILSRGNHANELHATNGSSEDFSQERQELNGEETNKNAGATAADNTDGANYQWEVYVDQSKSSLERGASATLDAFMVLSPPEVRVVPAVLPKTKAKGPIIRCIATNDEADCLEISNVDSVDKVYRTLTRHMRVQGVGASARECLKWKYKGNGHLELSEPALAIDAYDKALATGYSDQEGIILLMRSSAYLKLASIHQKELQELVAELSRSVPDADKLQLLYEEAAQHPSLSNAIFERIIADTKLQDSKFRKTKYRHGLYQYALLHAAQDSLRATQLLPFYSNAWIRAGEILGDLWKLKESAKYYEHAIGLDPSLTDSLTPVVERLRKRQELLESARAYGWSEDTLRLALDVGS